MASTNKTTHYELSQYVGTDKPAYLTDYNQDMSRIDAGIYGAKSLADNNETAIGDLSNLTTTAKTNLVGAINEVDSDLGTLSTTVGNHTTAIGNNTTAIGDLTNLTTTAKNNLVSAINEVDSQANTNTSNIGSLSNLDTTAKNNLVSALNEVKGLVDLFNLVNYNTCTVSVNGATSSESTVRCATNSDGSLFRLYGNLMVYATAWTNVTITISNTGLPTISEPYTIDGVGFRQLLVNESNNLRPISLTVNTNGSITISFGMESASSIRIMLFNGLYFNTNFGDTPQE